MTTVDFAWLNLYFTGGAAATELPPQTLDILHVLTEDRQGLTQQQRVYVDQLTDELVQRGITTLQTDVVRLSLEFRSVALASQSAVL